MSDELIRSAIAAAESAAGHVSYAYEVVRPAQAQADPNETNYDHIWRHLSGERRGKLEQDYKIWKVADEHVRAVRALAAQFPLPSQMKKRLSWTLRPPASWEICHLCNGRGDGDIGYCRFCQGDGYLS